MNRRQFAACAATGLAATMIPTAHAAPEQVEPEFDPISLFVRHKFAKTEKIEYPLDWCSSRGFQLLSSIPRWHLRIVHFVES